eukprot:scaffold11864_cov76-Phaeocystis_antarctica.AAC.2
MLQRSSATLRGFQGEIEPLGQAISVYKLKRQHDRQTGPVPQNAHRARHGADPKIGKGTAECESTLLACQLPAFIGRPSATPCSAVRRVTSHAGTATRGKVVTFFQSGTLSCRQLYTP